MSDLTEENIDKISKEDWKELIKLIPEIENTTVFGELIDDKMTSEGDMVFPYMKSSKIVSKFHRVIYDKNIGLVFDWMKWKEGQDILENVKGDYSEIDLITLVKLITTIVRNDRFCTGYLESKFQDGVILKILYRIKDIISNSD